MKDKFQMSVEDNSDFAKRIIVDSIYREARVEGINVGLYKIVWDLYL